jgi:MoaA/NifB/PqqE/SkfB family radical SAM enzyme
MDEEKKFLDRLVEQGMFYATELVARLPEKLLLSLAESRLRKSIVWEEGVDFLLKVITLLHRNWASFHPSVRKRFVENLFGNIMVESAEKRRRACEILGDYPVIMVISPTMRCNLTCTGCYSFNYERKDAISTERLDRLYHECEELGIGYIVVSGGEPYLRKDTIELFSRHPKLLFMTYTNGTLLADRKVVQRLAELGNVIPCVSVEGFEEETDARRGRGTHRKIRRAMQEMKEAGMLFGFSATPMRHNNELLCSDKFVEYYMELGCRIGWYFNYMPVGRSPDLELMPTPAQRLHRFHRVRQIRQKYDILAADFWCDGALVGGCMSGARTYFHVNASGGVEPCVFHQFYKDNINEKPLLECLNSEYFREVRCRLREIENPLRPCPIIDNPRILRELVAKHRPTPSQAGGDALLSGELAAGLDQYAAELKKIFDPVFEQIRDRAPWPLEPLGTMEEKKAAWQNLRQKKNASGTN